MRYLVFVAALGLVACTSAKSPTNALRAAVVMTAEAVEQADQLCATVGAERKDVTLLTTCKDSYNLARPALVAAQYYFDLGDEYGTEASLCEGQKALSLEASALVAAGVKMPPLVSEAITFAGSLCKVLHV